MCAVEHSVQSFSQKDKGGRSMGADRRRIFNGRLKRARRALSEAGWRWIERGAILVGISWLLLRARGDSTPASRQVAHGDFKRQRGY